MTTWRWLAISPEIELTLSLASDDPELIARVEKSAEANGIVLERSVQGDAEESPKPSKETE